MTFHCLIPIRFGACAYKSAQMFLQVEQNMPQNIWCILYRVTPHWVTLVMSQMWLIAVQVLGHITIHL